MNTTTAELAEVIDEPAEQNSLTKIVQESGLTKTKADYILERFQDYFRIASEWERKSKTLVVTSADQTTEMKMARDGRLYLRSKRIEIEHARKMLKEESIREGRAIDGIANVLKGLIEPIEDYLDQQERFVEIQEDFRREQRKAIRTAEIQSLQLDPLAYNLKDMTDEAYKQLVDGQRLLIRQREEEALRAETERIAREKAAAEEREIIRRENERLKLEAEENERRMHRERAEAERKRRELEEKTRKEREASEARERKLKAEQDAKLKKEREERQRLEAEMKRKAELEELERKRKAQELDRERLKSERLQREIDEKARVEAAKTSLTRAQLSKLILDAYNRGIEDAAIMLSNGDMNEVGIHYAERIRNMKMKAVSRDYVDKMIGLIQ